MFCTTRLVHAFLQIHLYRIDSNLRQVNHTSGNRVKIKNPISLANNEIVFTLFANNIQGIPCIFEVKSSCH